MFQIITDIMADFSDNFIKDNNVIVSGINPFEIMDAMIAAVDMTNDVLFIAASSMLCDSYKAAVVAADIVKDERQAANIVVIDSLSVSMGQGLLVSSAVKLQKEGRNLNEASLCIKQEIQHCVHCFTTSDHKKFKKNKSIKGKALFAKSLIKRRPLLKIDRYGNFICDGKVRSRKKALDSLIDMMKYYMGSFAGNIQEQIGIAYNGCKKDAEYVKEMIQKSIGMNNIVIIQMGEETARLVGQGSLGLFFLGESRNELYGKMVTSV